MIEWRRATPRDRLLVQAYNCAEPGGQYFDRWRRQKAHIEPWAEEVQKGLRKWSFRVAGAEMWLGFEGSELVSAGAYSQAGERQDSEDEFVIDYVSCAYEWRGRHLGDQCMGQLLADISDRTDYREGVGLFAYVHEENDSSKKLFQRFGFECESIQRVPIREGSGKKRLGSNYGRWVAQL